MMLLATVSLRNVSRHLVGVVGPYKQPYSKTLSLYRATYETKQSSTFSLFIPIKKRKSNGNWILQLRDF